MFLRTIPSAVSLLVLAATVVEPVDHRAQAQGPPAPRLDLHGDPLPEGAVARLGTVRLRHGYLLSGLAFSADGKEVFAADYYTGVHVWDAATGAERRRLLRAESYGHGMALSPDGRTLAVALGTLEVKLCDPATGLELGTLGKDSDRPSYLVFSRDGSLLATGVGKFVRVWDLATRQVTHRATFPEYVGRVAFSADGKRLVAGTGDGVRLRDLATNTEVGHLKNDPGGKTPLHAAVGGGDGHIAVWGYDDASVRLFDAAGTKELRRFYPDGGPAKGPPDAWGWVSLMAVNYSSDGKLLAIVRDVGRIELWDVATGKRRHTLAADASHRPTILAFSPDGTKLASSGSDPWGGDNTVRLWDVARGTELLPRAGHGARVTSVAFAPDGTTAATAGQDGIVHLWEATTGKHRTRLEGSPGRRPRVSFSSDGGRVVWLGTYGADGSLRVWDAKTGRALTRLGLGNPDAFWEAVSDDGKTAVSVDLKTRAVKYHDVATGKVTREVADGAYAPPLALSPRGDSTACADGRVRTMGRKELLQFGHLGYQNPTVRFSPDGRRLMAAVVDHELTKSFVSEPPAREVAVVDPVAGKELRRFGRPPGKWRPIDAAALSPDGKTVVTASPAGDPGADQVITLWEADTGRERGHFVGHRATTKGLAVSADGRLIVSGGEDTTALVWDATRPRARGVAARTDWAARFDDLSGDNGEQAYAALWAFANAPKEAVAFLGEQRDLFAGTDVKAIERWIRELDSDKFAERERASRELARTLDEAEPHLRKALDNHPSAEAERRIDLLLKARGPGLTGRELLRVRVIEALEHIAGPGPVAVPEAARQGAVAVLKRLAAGADDRATLDAKAALARLGVTR